MTFSSWRCAGDRYEANAPLPMEVVEAAKPYVDVLAFQDFSGKVCEHMEEWHTKTGMPVLWADGARPREVSGYGSESSNGLGPPPSPPCRLTQAVPANSVLLAGAAQTYPTRSASRDPR